MKKRRRMRKKSLSWIEELSMNEEWRREGAKVQSASSSLKKQVAFFNVDKIPKSRLVFNCIFFARKRNEKHNKL